MAPGDKSDRKEKPDDGVSSENISEEREIEMATDEVSDEANTMRDSHALVSTVERRDLHHLVSTGGPMPVAQAIEYLIQAARSIESAHALGITHGDITPGNLVLDTTGTVRVVNVGVARVVDATNMPDQKPAPALTQSAADIGTVDFMAPELADEPSRIDHRSDIFSLGCTLYFLLTGREPFPGETVGKKLMAHKEQAAPSLRAIRPDVSMTLEACYQKMMAKRPDDGPRSMTELIVLLQASTPPPDVLPEKAAQPPETPRDPTVSNERPPKRPGPPRTKARPADFARRGEREGLLIKQEWNLEDLLSTARPEAPPAPIKPPTTVARPLTRTAMPELRGRLQHNGAAIFALATSVLLVAAFVGFVASLRGPGVTENESRAPLLGPGLQEKTRPAKITPPVPPVWEQEKIFDGTSGQGWMLCNRGPIPAQNIQPDGLNPHRSGSYLVVYDQKLGDFVLDFDYKLTEGCNSGVFLRVSDLNNPVQTGIEVALDATRRGDDRDTGAFYGLVPPTVFAQKPVGEWNHITITAQGPNLAVSLNAIEVSAINLDLWTLPGKRPDGSDHRFKERAFAGIARTGYMGFQDLGGECWFKNIVLNSHSGGTRSNAPSKGRRFIRQTPGEEGAAHD
jgi:hypothetical protein